MPLVRKFRKFILDARVKKEVNECGRFEDGTLSFFTKQVPEVLSPYGSLSSSISPAAIKDA